MSPQSPLHTIGGTPWKQALPCILFTDPSKFSFTRNTHLQPTIDLLGDSSTRVHVLFL